MADILRDLTTSLETAAAGLPTVDDLLPPQDGISLLDAKNEIFLSYLQALALRNLNVIRSLTNGKSLEKTQELSDAITRKLVEHRVYLERGVRPLEQKIRFQIDRVVNVANDDERASQQKSKSLSKVDGGARKGRDADSGSEGSPDDEDSEEGSDEEVDQRLHRPNAASFNQVTRSSMEQGGRLQHGKDGVYRPPRISATSMPTTEAREPKERKAGRSATLDEYISTELSHAPYAEPSIGSTIVSGGRKTKDARQLAKEQERRDYEETNLKRLPQETRKERARQQRRDGGGGFGGEEWRGLGESVDRIGDLTRRKRKEGVLDKSRKRRAVEDGPRGDGIGDAFDLKKRRVMKKMRR